MEHWQHADFDEVCTAWLALAISFALWIESWVDIKNPSARDQKVKKIATAIKLFNAMWVIIADRKKTTKTISIHCDSMFHDAI